MEDLEKATFELWKDLRPADAYFSGIDDEGGKLFIPTRENIRSMRNRLDPIWMSTLDLSTRSLLRWARCDLDLQEPSRPPVEVVDALIGHLVKGGPGSPLLPPLLSASAKSMEIAASDLKLSLWPIEMKLHTLRVTGSLKTLLREIKGSGPWNGPIGNLEEKVAAYEELFPIEYDPRQDSGEVMDLLEGGAGHFGRSDVYHRILSELYSNPQRISLYEETVLMELYSEVPKFKSSKEEMSDLYGTAPEVEEIDREMALRRRIKEPSEAIRICEELREKLIYWAIRRLIDYPHEIDVGTVETPPYLKPFIGKGKVFNMDGLPARPRTDMFLTIGPERDSYLSFPDLMLLLSHEELGSRAHFLNSYLRPHESVAGTDLLPSTMIGSIMEGFAMDRELQVLGMLSDMSNRRSELMNDERYLVDHIEEFEPLDELRIDLEYLISRNRVLSLIRALADIRTNSGKQSVVDFIRWAHIVSGVEVDLLLELVMQAARKPGLHASSMIVSKGYHDVTSIMVERGADLLDLNTHSTCMGFPSWRFLRERSMDL
ncbi:MAG: hypothetical protein JXA22_06090 [Candidatus Thermoplasmatota archaeon]|nr:hypothetical protein [Candidatus Thermoplasmatota archaeon]